jgi:4-hydroxy-2-oxoheptanedioate aldolase
MKHPNRIKAAIAEGRRASGYNLTYPSPQVIEILAPFNFDFVWLDGEHGPFSLSDLEDHCRTAESVGVTPIARVPNIQSSTVLQYLDRGIQGIMGPHIATRADAEQLVKACLFGPQGERSFGGNRGCDYDFELKDKKAYYQQCNANMIVVALLEDGGVKQNLDEILSVPGIDYFSVGPNDFAQGIGYPGEPGRKEVVDAIEEIHDRIRSADQRVGLDVVKTEWVKAMLIDSARRFVESS